MPQIPDLIDPLSTEHVVLRLAAERDIPEVLIAHQDDACLHRALGMTRPPSGAELGREIERAAAARAAGSQVTFTIVEPGSEHCRGQVRARGFEWEHARAELEVWVAPQARGRGLAREGLKLAAAWLFESCGIARAELLAGPTNEPLIRAAQAAGFHREGTLRAHEIAPGSRGDRAVLSLLPIDLARAT